MNKYELIYIIDTNVEEAARKELIEKFNGIIAANGGEVVKVEEWGKRRLAYAIDYKTEGYYVYVAFNGASELPKELSRNLGINMMMQVIEGHLTDHVVKEPEEEQREAAPGSRRSRERGDPGRGRSRRAGVSETSPTERRQLREAVEETESYE